MSEPTCGALSIVTGGGGNSDIPPTPIRAAVAEFDQTPGRATKVAGSE